MDSSMIRCVFDDFDQFADSISGLNGRYLPTAHSQHKWWIDPMRVGDLRLQQLQVGAPATFAGDGEAEGFTVGIPLTTPGAIHIDGQPLAENGFICIRNDRPLTYSSGDVTRWAGVTLPMHLSEREQFRDAVEWTNATLGETRVTGAPAPLRRVRLLVGMLCATDVSSSIVAPAALATAEEDVLVAVAELLRASSCMRRQRPDRSRPARDQVIAQCLEFFDANRGSPVLVRDLCRFVGVTERTLRGIFREYFGVGPITLLRLRQLQEVRGALLSGARQESIADIAASFGVWNLSLFERRYHALYGEHPSETQRTWSSTTPHANGSDLRSLQSWTSFAVQRFAATGLAQEPQSVDAGSAGYRLARTNG